MPAFDLEALESRQLLASVKAIASLGGGGSGTTSGAIMPAFADQIGLTGKIDPTPTFDDEFNGTSIDTTKWQVREWTRHRVTPTSPLIAVTDRSSVVVKNGELQLIAYTDPATGEYRSGWIQTDTNGGVANDPYMVPGSNAHFTQQFGYWEARIKSSSVNGMWNAFWVHSSGLTGVGDDPSKANHPEIYGTEMDVVENGATFQYTPNQNAAIHTTVHANGYASQHISSAAGSTLTDPYGYHTYGLLWDATSVSVYVDGYMMYHETNPNLVSKVKQFAILSNEIGATGSNTLGEGRTFWGVPPTGGYGDVTTSQAKMTVDYVRVWKLGNGTTTVPVVVPVNVGSITRPSGYDTPVGSGGGGSGGTITDDGNSSGGGTGGGGTGGTGGAPGSGTIIIGGSGGLIYRLGILNEVHTYKSSDDARPEL